MRRLIYILCAAVIIAVSACHEEHEDYFAEAAVTVNAGDTVTVDRVQATAVLTNLNTREVTTSSDFNGQTLHLSLLRGAYIVSIEGLIKYTNAARTVYTRRFRAYTDYAEMAQTKGNSLVLNVIWID
ncbi:MAG: hypothetical protein ACTTJL_01820 [Hoylesella enoeca]|uniref:hypothetical protein n=1 Tax=Hoylesella enoeca TaxID=76123 RepID=UPI003F9F49A6